MSIHHIWLFFHGLFCTTYDRYALQASVGSIDVFYDFLAISAVFRLNLSSSDGFSERNVDAPMTLRLDGVGQNLA